MKVYTKTGDQGTTALFGGTRVPKDHIRIESYGTVDELNSHIGLVRDQEMNLHYKEILAEIQDRLFTIGAILATPPEKEVMKNGELRLQKLGILESDIELLEK
jgi:cob(I)alamin adenosyltransferase